jgi:ketosteroid isomerase-like protein
MKTRNGMLLLGIALLALSLSAHAEKPHAKHQEKKPLPPISKDEVAIRQAEDALIAAYKAKDVEKIMSYYAKRDDLVIYDITPPTHRGWQEYRKATEELLQNVKRIHKMEFHDVDSHVVGEMGYFAALWRLEIVTADDQTEAMEGRVTDVWQKIGGKWLIVHEHSSLPQG